MSLSVALSLSKLGTIDRARKLGLRPIKFGSYEIAEEASLILSMSKTTAEFDVYGIDVHNWGVVIMRNDEIVGFIQEPI